MKDTICRITLKANKLSVSDIGARTRRPSPGHCSNRNHKSNFQSAHSSILTLFTLTFGKPSAGHFRLAEQYFGHPCPSRNEVKLDSDRFAVTFSSRASTELGWQPTMAATTTFTGSIDGVSASQLESTSRAAAPFRFVEPLPAVHTGAP